MDITATYDAYVDKVYSYFYIKSYDRTIAEDLTSQTFLTVVERSQDPDYVIGDMKKFVYGVMRLIWLRYLRDKYQHAELPTESIEDFEDDVDHEVEDYQAKTVKQRAEVYIQALPERQRDIVTMRLLEGMTIRDICRHMTKDNNYVKTTYKRGVKNLRALIADGEGKETI